MSRYGFSAGLSVTETPRHRRRVAEDRSRFLGRPATRRPTAPGLWTRAGIPTSSAAPPLSVMPSVRGHLQMTTEQPWQEADVPAVALRPDRAALRLTSPLARRSSGHARAERLADQRRVPARRAELRRQRLEDKPRRRCRWARTAT